MIQMGILILISILKKIEKINVTTNEIAYQIIKLII